MKTRSTRSTASLGCAMSFALAVSLATPACAATLVTLDSFTGSNGGSPRAGLVIGADGTLYGTASTGGVNNAGVVFAIPVATGKIRTVAGFDNSNGAGPIGRLARDGSGNLYGTTYVGGPQGRGTVYGITAGSTAITTLATFEGTSALNPWSGVTLDGSGNLYGTTRSGGATGSGTVYRVSPGSTTPTILSDLGGADGKTPFGSLVSDGKGSLFGTTTDGAAGFGTVFRVDTATGKLTTIVTFDRTNGANPYGTLTIDGSGNLYGTTSNGFGNGSVFRIDAGSNRITTLAKLPFGGVNGYNPNAGVLLDAAGNIFGAAYSGGSAGYGTIFRIDAGTNALVTLANFAGGTEGRSPETDLVADASGNLYGTTWRGGSFNRGTVFKLSDAGFVTSMSAVPEPASWGMMIVGFGLVGGTLRSGRYKTRTLRLQTC